MIALDKIEIRKKKIQERLDLSDKEYQNKSNLIINKLKKEAVFQQAKTIGIYISFNNEVNTLELIEELLKYKVVCVPKTHKEYMDFHIIKSFKDLTKGNFGILEPDNKNIIPKNQIDLMIVPLVAYDKNNNRIGYGGGYYDRYLQECDAYTVGLAFSCQLVDEINNEPTDISLKQIINEL